MMQLKNEVTKDNSKFGNFRLALYMFLKSTHDSASMQGEKEIANLIEGYFGSGKAFQLGKTDYLISGLKGELEGLSSEESEFNIKALITALTERLALCRVFTPADTSLANRSDVSILHPWANSGTYGAEFLIGDNNPIAVKIAERSSGDYDATVFAKSQSGNKVEFQIMDNGNLYEEIIDRVVNDPALTESYKYRDVVKDAVGRDYKVVKVEDGHYKLKAENGAVVYVDKENFDPLSKKADVKEDVTVGQSVNTPNGKGKIKKIDKDNAWVELDSDANIGGTTYKKGTEVAYKKASLVSEAVKLSDEDLTDLTIDVKSHLEDSKIELVRNFDIFDVRGMVMDYLNLGFSDAKEIAKRIERDVEVSLS